MSLDLLIKFMHSQYFRQYTRPITEYNPWWESSSAFKKRQQEQAQGKKFPVITIGYRRPQYAGTDTEQVVRFPGTANITQSICFGVSILYCQIAICVYETSNEHKYL